MRKTIKMFYCSLILFIGLGLINPSQAFCAPANKEVIVLIKNVSLQKSGDSIECVIRSTGIGKPPRTVKNAAQRQLLAERAARVGAYRNLLRASTRIEPISKDGVAVVDGFLEGARIIQKRYMSDGTVEIDMGLDIRLKGGGRHPVKDVVFIETTIRGYGYPVGVVHEETVPVTVEDLK